MRRIAIGTSLIIMSWIVLPSASPSTLQNVGDISRTAIYTLDTCTSEMELDCIESVGLFKPDNSYVEGEFAYALLKSSFDDAYGNRINQGISVWKVGSVEIQLDASLETPQHIIYRFDNGELHRGGALRLHYTVAEPLVNRVRIKVRTSWLKPQNIQIKLTDSDYKDELIPGGHRWTFEGSGLQHSSYNYGDGLKDSDRSQRADYDGILTDIFIHHAGVDSLHSYFSPSCADNGYTVQTNNTNATGTPEWDARSETLIFGVYAPHFKASGELNEGYFKFWTTDDFLNCKFPGNTLTKSPNLKVQVLYEDGTQSTATTEVIHKEGKLSLIASGFHFSAPKIVITPIKADTSTVQMEPSNEPEKVLPSSKPSTIFAPKPTTIKCVKGKTAIRVRGIAPKCPKGYKVTK